MTNAIHKITTALIFLVFSCQGQHLLQFSDEFLKMINHAPLHHNTIQPIYASNWPLNNNALPRACPIKPGTLNKTDPQPAPSPSSISSANAYRLINCATMGYALINIYNSYQNLHSTGSSCITALMLGRYITFLTDCIETTCKALLYKTVAQCIVFCAEGNIIDLMRYGLQKVTHSVL